MVGQEQEEEMLLEAEGAEHYPAAAALGTAPWKLLLPLVYCTVLCHAVLGRQASGFSRGALASAPGLQLQLLATFPGSGARAPCAGAGAASSERKWRCGVQSSTRSAVSTGRSTAWAVLV